MHTRTKLDRYNPNVRKNDIIRHIKSPATQETVIDQPISSGIIRNVTSKSAIAKWVSIASMRVVRFARRFSNITRTVVFPMDENTIKILCNKEEMENAIATKKKREDSSLTYKL